MFDLIVTQVVGGAVILAIGIGVFFAVNTRRPSMGVERTDPKTGERRTVILYEFGTRRSRWRGYCVIGGTVLGFQGMGLVVLVDAMRHGVTSFTSMALMEALPCGMVFGLLAGLALGAISSQFVPERTRPPDPDTP